MNISYMVHIVTAAVAIALGASTAYSQPNISTALQTELLAGAERLKSSCGDEIKNFCSTVTPGEGREVLCIRSPRR